MPAATGTITPRSIGIDGILRSHIRILPDRLSLLGLLIALVSLTRGFYLGDTTMYVSQILNSYGKAPAPNLWEFGHLLWRPMGWALMTLFGPLLERITGLPDVEICSGILVAISLLTGAATVLIWHSILLRLTGSRRVAFITAAAFSFANAFLTYIHAGTAYVPGLFFISLSIWLLSAPRGIYRRNRLAVYSSAAAAAVGTLLWFPYMLAIPGIAAASAIGPFAWLQSGRDTVRRPRVHNARRLLLTFFFCLAVVYAIGAVLGDINSLPKLKAWVAASGHGWSQDYRFIRLGTGLPRTFIFIGDDGVLYRRLLRRDPYAPVGLTDILRASFWKISAFFAFLYCLIRELTRGPQRWPRVWLAAAAAPVLWFAVCVFEPGSPERYLPMYPFLVIAVAWALQTTGSEGRLRRGFIAAFLAAMAITNFTYTFRPRIDREDASSIRRASRLLDRANRGDLIVILNNRDDIARSSNRALFSKLNAPTPVRLYDAIETSTERLPTWRSEFAEQVLKAWSAGQQVWVSKRFWSRTPDPRWDWVEGDDPRIAWSEIPELFAMLRPDADPGDPDGFLHLSPRVENVTALRNLLPTTALNRQ